MANTQTKTTSSTKPTENNDENSFVVSGAKVECNCGSVGSALILSEKVKYKIGLEIQAMDTDYRVENFTTPFETCKKTKKECELAFREKWIEVDEKQVFGEEKMHPLQKKSQLVCSKGGVVKILENGQGMGGMSLEDKEAFIQMLRDQFGFDLDPAKDLFELYSRIANTKYYYRKEGSLINIFQYRYPTNKETALAFFQTVGAASYAYNEDSSWVSNLKNQFQWAATAGIPPNFVDILRQYGYSDDKAQSIKKFLNDQHDESGKTGYFADFTHMSVTVAANLASGDIGQFLAGYGGSFIQQGMPNDAKKLAGYAGDIFLPPHSIGNDDYLADLDALNLANLLKNGGTLPDVMNQYYSGIQGGTASRTDQFLQNLGNGNKKNGLQTLENEINDYITINERNNSYGLNGWGNPVYNENGSEETYQQSKSAVEFYLNIKNGNSSMEGHSYTDEELRAAYEVLKK